MTEQELSPEMTLVYAVLERTVSAAIKPPHTSDDARDAYAWVTHSPPYSDPHYASHVFSFEGACSCLRINPDRLRRMVTEARR